MKAESFLEGLLILLLEFVNTVLIIHNDEGIRVG